MSPRYVRAAAVMAAVFVFAPAVIVMRASAGTIAAAALYSRIAPRPPQLDAGYSAVTEQAVPLTPGMIVARNQIASVQQTAAETFLHSARMLALAAESTIR